MGLLDGHAEGHWGRVEAIAGRWKQMGLLAGHAEGHWGRVAVTAGRWKQMGHLVLLVDWLHVQLLSLRFINNIYGS